jgi:hypothetical protein
MLAVQTRNQMKNCSQMHKDTFLRSQMPRQSGLRVSKSQQNKPSSRDGKSFSARTESIGGYPWLPAP